MSTEESSGPRQRAGATKRRRTSTRILEVTRSLLDEYGYHGVTLDAIARVAGVSPATLANHYPTKRALVMAAHAPVIQSLMQHTEATIAEGKNPKATTVSFIRTLAEDIVGHPAFAIALLPLSDDMRPQHEVVRSADTVTFGQLVIFLGDLLERCAADVRYPVPAMDTANFCLSGLLLWILQHPERSGDDAIKLALSQLHL